MHLILKLNASCKWLCWSIDIKSAFLQNKNVNRVVYVKPPKEADCQDIMLLKLNTFIYGLNDASRSWYLNVKKKLTWLGAIVCKSDTAVFIWHSQSKVNGLLCTHVDDFLLGGTELFLIKVLNPIKHVFTTGSEQCAAFKYLCLYNSQSNLEIIIDQVNYIKSVDYIAISNDRKNQKDDLLWKEENDYLRTLVGHLGWITGQTRLDLALRVCQMSSTLNHSKVDDTLKASKLLLKAKNKNILVRFGLHGPIENFKIFYYNDSSLGNLKDGESQSRFIIYLVGESKNLKSYIQ